MHATKTLIMTPPGESQPVVYEAGTDLPDWLVDVLKSGNPDILEEESDKPKAEKKSKNKTSVMAHPDTKTVKPYEGVPLSDLEEIAINSNLDPDEYGTREQLIQALLKNNAPKTLTKAPAPSSDNIDAD